MLRRMERILFYDGECGICNRSVQFLQRHDPDKRLRYEPLQGTVAEAVLPQELTRNLDTAVYCTPDGRLLLRSDAVLHALIDTGTGWRFIASMTLKLPRSLRDPVYNRIAANRDRCELPKEP